MLRPTPAGGSKAQAPATARLGVSVIVPFRGDAAAAARLERSLASLLAEAGAETIVADNSRQAARFTAAGIRVVRATSEPSSYHARNAGAARAAGEWMLFFDADCVPDPAILRSYLADPPAADVGALAGSVLSDPAQRHFLARYAGDRGFLDQDSGLHTADDAAATANLMVRREAFERIGGFTEGIRSGGDVDFCRRLRAAGWRIERRGAASVHHLHRESLPDLLGSLARYAAGARWLNDRYPGTAPRWPLGPSLVDCGRDIAGDLARRRFERAAFRGVDALGVVAHAIGYGRSNASG